jgi:predicted GTPase
MRDPHKAPVVVIAANKIDVADRYVTPEECRELADQLKVTYFEVSAQNNTNIDEMFTFVVRELRKKRAPVSKRNENRRWWHGCQLL